MAEDPEIFTQDVGSGLWYILRSINDNDLETFSTGAGMDFQRIYMDLYLIALDITFFKG